MSEECYISVEQSIIEACKEVREMRAGRLPKRSLDDFMVELKKWIEEEENANDNSNNRQIRARR